MKCDTNLEHRAGAALKLACENGHLECVKLLINEGAKYDATTDVDILLKAVRSQKLNVVEYLVSDLGAKFGVKTQTAWLAALNEPPQDFILRIANLLPPLKLEWVEECVQQLKRCSWVSKTELQVVCAMHGFLHEFDFQMLKLRVNDFEGGGELYERDARYVARGQNGEIVLA